MSLKLKEVNAGWIKEIPVNWSVKKVKEVYEFVSVKVSDTEYPALTVSSKYGITPQMENVAKTQNGDSRKRVEKGDFVINSRADRPGACGISNYDGSVSMICHVLKARYKDILHEKYMHYLFRNNMFSQEFFRWGRGIVSDLWSTRKDDFGSLQLPIPPFSEQKIIGEYLDYKEKSLNTLIRLKENQLEMLSDQRQSIITEAVTKGLNPNVKMKDSGVEWIGEIPEHWLFSKIGYLGRLQNGISKSSEEFGYGTPFVSYGDVYKNEVLPTVASGLVNASEEDRKLYSVQYGDVFFTRTSETVDEIGIASTCLQTIEDATFAGFLIRFRPTTNRLSPHFARFYFRSNLGRRYFVKEMNLVTRASLGQGLLRGFTVLLPPLEEQEQIASYLESKTHSIDESISLVNKQIEKLKEYRQSLIYEAVTGKIDVRELELN
ncbi:restriction endonuclease subunit S [Niallia sp. MER 6]|uniref:restriction endonuclease subunit S n=1 Tax=Niallia sp. MER 6 TaxID=2939567 RepID=UPI0020417C37|nr:restriction endonuclease subunit S [Niallia sp. MER 6]MCM3031499.1 restriction endonuclease subunit S [Niallia sp. MER 6]